MDKIVNIPNYPNVCRICFVETTENDAIPAKALMGDGVSSFWSALSDLCSLGPEPINEDRFPQQICHSCAKQIETFRAFCFETNANQQFLKAWIAYRFGENTGPWTKLMRDQTNFHPTIRKTLHRLKVVDSEDTPLEQLITNPSPKPNSDSDEWEIKVEIICDADELEVVEQNGDIDIEQRTEELRLKQTNNSKRRKRSANKVLTRPCYLENCEPIPVGKAFKHTRDLHRSYCKVCGLVFVTYALAVRHLAIHKNDEDRFRCKICDKPFWHENKLYIHRREFHGIDDLTHECPVCGDRFGKRIELLEHRKVHNKCKFCTKDFKNYRTMWHHTKKDHRERLIPCDTCEFLFFSQKELKTHARKHRDGRLENTIQFSLFDSNWTAAQCSTCERDYYNLEYREIHTQRDHKKGLSEKPTSYLNYKRRMEYKFKCGDCPARFRMKTSLKAHWRAQHSGQQLICEHCGACFKGQFSLERHRQYMHIKDTPFSCELCDKRCITKQALKVHMRSHTNEKPHKCWFEGCDKAYKSRTNLTIHHRVHTGERPYKCTHEGCDKSYSYIEQLTNHNRYHTQEKPFKCWYCELPFSTTDSRRKHCLRRHPGMPIGKELERRLNQRHSETGSSVDELADSSRDEDQVVEAIKIEPIDIQ